MMMESQRWKYSMDNAPISRSCVHLNLKLIEENNCENGLRNYNFFALFIKH